MYRKQRNYKVFLLYRSNQLTVLPTNLEKNLKGDSKQKKQISVHMCFSSIQFMSTVHPSIQQGHPTAIFGKISVRKTI